MFEDDDEDDDGTSVPPLAASKIGAFVDGRSTWDPAVPHDLHASRPAVADDGTSVCSTCGQRLPLSALNITDSGYRCGACANARIRAELDAAVDPSDLVVGRGRWWLVPSITLAIIALTVLGALFIPVKVLLGVYVVIMVPVAIIVKLRRISRALAR